MAATGTKGGQELPRRLAGGGRVEGENFVEAGGEFGHAGEDDVGAGLAEDLGVEGTGVDGDGEDAGGMTCLDT